MPKNVRVRDDKLKTTDDAVSGDAYDATVKACLTRALTPYREVRGQGTSTPGDQPWDYAFRDQALAQGDRYQTAGGAPPQNAAHENFAPAKRAETAQNESAKQKGSATEQYRKPIDGVVQ